MNNPAGTKRICPLFAEAEKPVYADDIAKLLFYKFTPNDRGKVDREPILPEEYGWPDVNFYNVDEHEFRAKIREPGEYMVQARNERSEVLSQVKINIRSRGPMAGPARGPGQRASGPSLAMGTLPGLGVAGAAAGGEGDDGGMFSGEGDGGDDFGGGGDEGPDVQSFDDAPGKILTFKGLPPAEQAQLAFAQRALAAEERRLKEERQRLERERAAPAAPAAAAPAADPFAMFERIASLQEKLRGGAAAAAPSAAVADLEEKIRWYRGELETKTRDMDELRRTHRLELERCNKAMDDAADIARKKRTELEDELAKVKRELAGENLKLARDLATTEVQLEAAENGAAPQATSETVQLLNKVTEILPAIPKILAALKGSNIDLSALAALASQANAGGASS